MKQIKISMIAILAIAMGFLTSAFTTPVSSPNSVGWFSYDQISNPANESSYSYSGPNSPCSGSDILCAIKGTSDPLHPTQPRQTDVDAAKLASSNFTTPVTGEVDFEAQ